MAAKPLMLPANRAFNSNGLAVPFAVAKLYTTGTVTPQPFYSDVNLSVSLGSSITANGSGRFDTAYQDENTPFRLRVEDPTGLELDDIDPFYFGQIFGITDANYIPITYLDTDTSLTANSDTKLATQKAIKAYVDSSAGAATGTYTDEKAQDATAAAFAAGTHTNITVTYNDASNSFSVATTGFGTASADDRATTAQIQAASANKVVEPDKLFAAAALQTLTDGATINWDMSLGFNAKVTVAGNRTLGTPTNPVVGIDYSLAVIQDGTGSRTMTWPASFDWGAIGAPTLTTTASKVDQLIFRCTDAATPKFRAYIAGKGFAS